MTKAKSERNAKIYADKVGGASWADLIRKYNLSFTTLRNIVLREKLTRATE